MSEEWGVKCGARPQDNQFLGGGDAEEESNCNGA